MKKNNTIVICDDDEGIVDVTKIVLEEKGYLVWACTNSEEFFEVVKKVDPALIFLDLWMPGKGGEEITKELKKEQETQKIPVVIMSANKDTRLIAEKAGADNFLCKPFDILELEKMAEHYVDDLVR